ncbi:TolC family protein [Sphingobacterium sp. KU25419]|nr:TolC family protein [Sphingobacterium sp. KU25419]
MDDAITQALNANLNFKNTALELQKSKLDEQKSFDGKTGLFIENEDFSPMEPNGIWKVGLSQDFAWPGFYKARKELLRKTSQMVLEERENARRQLIRDVSLNYYQLIYLEARQSFFSQLDSTHQKLYESAKLRVKTGEAAGLEQMAAETKWQENKTTMLQNEQDLAIAAQNFSVLLNDNSIILPIKDSLQKIKTTPYLDSIGAHPLIKIQQKSIEIAEANTKMEAQAKLPDFSGRAFSQKLWGQRNAVTGISLTMNIPMFSTTYYQNKVKVAELETAIEKQELEQLKMSLTAQQAMQKKKSPKMKNNCNL